MDCFCGHGRAVPFRLRGPNRGGVRAAAVQRRLVEEARPLLDAHRTDRRLGHYAERFDALAREGEDHLERLSAMVHGEEPSRRIKGLADWMRAARETGDTIVLAAEAAARERERGF